MTQPSFFFAEDQAFIEATLERLLPSETTPPATIHQAMRYSVFAGGKRIRPILCCEAARLFPRERGAGARGGRAWNFIHPSALIHDDRPALDNDDWGRDK